MAINSSNRRPRGYVNTVAERIPVLPEIPLFQKQKEGKRQFTFLVYNRETNQVFTLPAHTVGTMLQDSEIQATSTDSGRLLIIDHTKNMEFVFITSPMYVQVGENVYEVPPKGTNPGRGITLENYKVDLEIAPELVYENGIVSVAKPA